MNQRYLLALDQGTTSSRAVLFTKEGQVVASEAFEVIVTVFWKRPGRPFGL